MKYKAIFLDALRDKRPDLYDSLIESGDLDKMAEMADRAALSQIEEAVEAARRKYQDGPFMELLQEMKMAQLTAEEVAIAQITDFPQETPETIE